MKFGICSAPGALGDERRLIEILVEAGADYLEWSVGAMMASEGEFEKLRSIVALGPLRPEAFMAFLPPHHRVTGPGVDLESTLNYATTAMQRGRALGGEIFVLGSAGARKVPHGFDPDHAKAQFVQFCRELGPRAQEIGLVIALEPLNRSEDNLICSVAQGAETVRAIAHPHVRLLADYYHMREENESLHDVDAAASLLCHTHLADTARKAPGFVQPESDISGFFGALRRANYDARCSFEGKIDDLARQAKPILAAMRQKHAQCAL